MSYVSYRDTQRHRMAMAMDPSNLEAFLALNDEYRRTGRWADLARLLESRAASARDDSEALHCLMAAGDLWLDRLREASRAVDCFKDASRIAPRDRVVLAALQEAYEAAGRHRELRELLETRLESEESPEARGQIHTMMAAISRRMGDAPAAVAHLVAAHEANPFLKEGVLRELETIEQDNPRDPRVLDSLIDALGRLGEWERVADLYRRKARVAVDSQEKADVYCDLADMLRERGFPQDRLLAAYSLAAEASPLDPSRLVAGLDDILRKDPSCRPAYRMLRKVYGDQHRWSEVLDLMEDEVELAQGREAAELLLEMGALEVTGLGRPDRAAAHYLEAFRRAPELASRVTELLGELSRSHPDAPGIRRAMAEVLSATGQWGTLAGLLEDSSRTAGRDVERLEQRIEAARVYLERMGDPARARELGLDVLAQDPEHRRARELLEHLLELYPEDTATLDALRTLYVEHQRWRDLARLLERHLDSVHEGQVKAELHYELGQIWETRLDHQDAAMSHYQAAFRLVPTDERFIEAGRRLYRQARRWPMVLKLLDLGLQVARDEERRHQLLLEKADLLSRRLDRPVEACDILLDLLDANPRDEQARKHLASLLQVAEDRRRAFEDLERKGKFEEQSERAARKLLMAGKVLAEEVSSREPALEAFERAHEIDPEYDPAFTALEGALEEAGAWLDLARLYARRAARELDGDKERHYRLAAAGILGEKLGDWRAAAHQLRLAMEISPDDAEILSRLRGILVEHRMWRDVEELFKWLLVNHPGAGDHSTRLGLLRDWASICTGPMGSVDAALEPYRMILDMVPGDREALELHRQVLGARGRWRELLALYDRAWLATGDRGILATAATIASRELNDPRAAMERWRTLVEKFPGDREALDALEAMHRETGETHALVGILMAQAEEIQAPTLRLRVLRGAVDAAREVEDLSTAREALEQLLAISPGDQQALADLSEVLEAQGDWEALVEVLGRRIDGAPGHGVAASLLETRAEILVRNLERYEDALEDLARLRAMGAATREALDLELQALSHHRDAPRELEVLGILEAMAESDGERAGVLARMAHLADVGLRDPDKAVGYWTRILDSFPGHQEALEALAGLYRRLGDGENLAGILELRLGQAGTTARKKEILFELGELYQYRLEDLDRAEETWRRLLALEPDEPTAMARLQELYDSRQDWEELVGVLARRVELEPDPFEAAQLLGRRASILKTALGRLGDAVRDLEQAVQRVPDDPDLLRELRASYLEQGEYARAVGTIEQELAIEEVEDRKALCFTAALIERNDIKDPEGAIRWYERVLTYDPGDMDALKALAELHRRRGDWHAMAEVVGNLLPGLQAPEERQELLMALAEVEQAGGRYDDAFRHLREAYQAAPESGAEAMEAMERLAEDQGLWEELIAALQWEMVRLPAQEDKLGVLAKIAGIQEESLGDLQRAMATWKVAFTMAPSERGPIEEIRRLAKASGSWDTYLDCLEHLATSETRLHKRIELRRAKATILEQEVGDLDAAFQELEAAFKLDPSFEPVQEEIERLAEGYGEYGPLLDVFSELLDKVENLRARIYLLGRMAAIHEHHMGDPEAALGCVARALEMDPEDGRIQEELDRLGEVTGAWQRVQRAYEAADGPSLPPRLRARFLVRRAELQERFGEDPEGAFRLYQEAFLADPRADRPVTELSRLAPTVEGGWEELLGLLEDAADHAGTIELEAALRRSCLMILEQELHRPEGTTGHLERLWEIEEATEDELTRLAGRLTDEGQWRTLLELLATMAARGTEEQRQARLFRMAEIQERELGDLQGAVKTLRQVVEEHPGHREAMERLVGLYSKLGDWERVVDTLETMASAADAPEEADALGIRIAWIWARELARPTRAIRRLRLVLQRRPDHQAAFEALDTLLTQEGRWDDLYELLETRLDLPGITKEERLALLDRMASIAWERFGNRKRALRCLNRMVREDPGNLAALEKMASHLEAEARWGDLMVVLEDLASRAKDQSEAAARYLEMGKIQEEKLLSRWRAVQAYHEAARLAPEDPRPLEALDRLYEELEEWEALAEVREARVKLLHGSSQEGPLLLELARVQLEHLRDEPAAVGSLGRALALAPELASRVEAWRSRYTTRKDRRSLLALLAVEKASTTDPVRAADLLCEMGRIARDTGDKDRALEHYTEALALRPDHVQALWAICAIHRSRGSWAEVDHNMDRLVRLLSARASEGRGDQEDQEVRTWLERLDEIYVDWARVALLMGERAKATARLSHALELAPGNQAARRLLADIHFEDGHWEAAAMAYGELLQAQGTGPKERATYLFRMGKAQVRLGRFSEAVTNLQACVLKDPDNHEARELVVESLERLQAWKEAVSELERLVSRTTDAQDRYRLLVRLATLLHQRLGRDNAAIVRLEEAHRLAPGDPTALRMILDISGPSGDPHHLIEVADALLQITDDRAEAFRLHMLRGRLFLEELHRLDEAAEAFRRAMDLDPLASDAVQGLAKALEPNGQWEELAGMLREHMEALGSKGAAPPMEVGLHLAELLVDHLGRPEEALGILADMEAHHGESAELHRLAATALDAVGRAPEEIMAALERALELDPMHLATRHRLFEVAMAAGDRTRALAQALILGFVRAATDEERGVLERIEDIKPDGLADLLGSDLLADPPLSGPVDELMDALVRELALPEPSGERLEDNPHHSLAKRFQEVERLLGMDGMALWVSEQPGRDVLPVPGRGLVVGRGLLQGLFRREQRFYLARGLAGSLRGRALAWVLDPEEGQALLDFLAAPGPEAQAPPRLEHLPAERLQALLDSLGELARAAPEGSFHTWRHGVLAWALRLAVVASGDLGVALKALRLETGAFPKAALREAAGLGELLARSALARDLISWMSSPRYAALLTKLAEPTQSSGRGLDRTR